MMMFHDKSAKDLEQVHSSNISQRIKMSDSESYLKGLKLEHESSKGNSTMIQAIFVLIKSLSGIVMMTMPYGFSYSGVLGGIIGVFIVVIVNIRSVILLSRAAEKQHKLIRSISELTSIVLGPFYEIIMVISIFLMQSGLNIAYFMFSGSQIDQIV